MARVAIPVIYRQIGWMPCIACSDAHKMSFGKFRGQMWLGKNPDGSDIWIECPVCHGSAQTPRYETLDARTGERIDYEGMDRDKDGNLVPLEIVPVDAPQPEWENRQCVSLT